MTRFRAFALTFALTIVTAGCTPALTATTGDRPSPAASGVPQEGDPAKPGNAAATDDRPIPAASGVLRVGDPAKPGDPPVLILDPPNALSSLFGPGREDDTIYKVVINFEGAYSVWPDGRENALGWQDAGKSGTLQECMAYIQEVWTDMRPLSLRKKMEEMERQRQQQQR
jgi:MbtH protein